MPPAVFQQRVASIDLLKGLVMIVIALDHVRDYFHYSVHFFNPVDPVMTTAPIFFTRFITHYCAPTFSFLAVLSVFLSGRAKPKATLSVFLIKRGVWLVLLELTLITFGWAFDPAFRMNGIAVIACLGCSMLLLGVLIHLPRILLLALCCFVIVAHHLLDPITLPGNVWWSIVHQPGICQFPRVKFYVDYPIIPWFAVMGLGYCFGSFYDKEVNGASRRKWLTTIGISAIVLFFAMRWLNIYGDPAPWVHFDEPTKTALSFLNVTKYPPSLLYLLVTLGPALVFLANTENASGRAVKFLATFGRVPFFYYLIHIYIIHLLAAFFGKLTGHGWQLLVLKDWIPEMNELKGYGTSLFGVYLVWALVIAITYPLCKWYDQYKTHHKEKWWLRYL